MTTSLIESTSSAPTLIERAAAAGERARLEAEQEARKRAESERLSAIATLASQIENHLGVVVDGAAIKYDPDARPGATLDIDGLTFAMFRYPSYSDRDSLSVARHCVRGCGQPVWVEITDYRLESLDRAITEPQTHVHDCLVRYDDDGEPITDRFGNPLPPQNRSEYRADPVPSPVDEAHLAIRLVEDAGEQVAQTHDTVTRLADGRAEAKAAAILRLMQTMNPLTHKQHSAASAEAVVESDLDFASYRAVERAAEVERWRALAHYESAKLVAALDVGLAQTTNGMRNSE